MTCRYPLTYSQRSYCWRMFSRVSFHFCRIGLGTMPLCLVIFALISSSADSRQRTDGLDASQLIPNFMLQRNPSRQEFRFLEDAAGHVACRDIEQLPLPANCSKAPFRSCSRNISLIQSCADMPEFQYCLDGTAASLAVCSSASAAGTASLVSDDARTPSEWIRSLFFLNQNPIAFTASSG